MLREMQLGKGRSEALRGLAERTNVDDLKTFVGAMVQADAFGISISQVLRVQSGRDADQATPARREARSASARQDHDPADPLRPAVFDDGRHGTCDHQRDHAVRLITPRVQRRHAHRSIIRGRCSVSPVRAARHRRARAVVPGSRCVVGAARPGRPVALPGHHGDPPRPGADPLAARRGGRCRRGLRPRHAVLSGDPGRARRTPALRDGRRGTPPDGPQRDVPARHRGQPRTDVAAGHAHGGPGPVDLLLVDGRRRPEPGRQRDVQLRSPQPRPAGAVPRRAAPDQAAHRAVGRPQLRARRLGDRRRDARRRGRRASHARDRALRPSRRCPRPGRLEHRSRPGGRGRVREVGNRCLGARRTGDRRPGLRLRGRRRCDRRRAASRAGSGARRRPAVRGAEGGARDERGQVRHRVALLALPGRRDCRRAAAPGARDARRRRPGHRVARLPRRRARRAVRPTTCRPGSSRCSASG